MEQEILKQVTKITEKNNKPDVEQEVLNQVTKLAEKDDKARDERKRTHSEGKKWEASNESEGRTTFLPPAQGANFMK